MLSWHRADPTSHWIKVVDENTGAVVGGGRWALYEKEQGNPYEGHGGGVEASWWPEGTPRKVASGYLNEFLATSAKLMGRPHACEFFALLFFLCGLLVWLLMVVVVIVQSVGYLARMRTLE